MRSVERAEFASKLDEMIRLVKEGETVAVLEGGREVARFTAPARENETEGEILDRLEREGRISKGKGPAWIPLPKLDEGTDRTATDWLIGEGRDDRV